MLFTSTIPFDNVSANLFYDDLQSVNTIKTKRFLKSQSRCDIGAKTTAWHYTNWAYVLWKSKLMYRLKEWCKNQNPDRQSNTNESNITKEKLNQKDKQRRISQNIGSEAMLCRIFHNSSTTGATRRSWTADSSGGIEFNPD